MMDFVTTDQILVLLTVIGIDLALSADNAVVIGLAAATLPTDKRARVIALGTLAAALLRIVLAIFAAQLLGVVGLILAGGVLLLYVSWKLWWDLKGHAEADAEAAHQIAPASWEKGAFRRAVIRIVLADLSMSVENVLAVAGAARHHISIMIIGLALSILLTGIAASVVAKLLDRHRWIGYVGVAMIVWVSLRMIWDGGLDILARLGIAPPF